MDAMDSAPTAVAPAAVPPPPDAAAVTAAFEQLKRDLKQQISVLAIRVPKQQCTHYIKLLAKHMFNKPRLRNVLDDPADPSCRLLLLDEAVGEADLEALKVPAPQQQTDPQQQQQQQSVAALVACDGLAVTTAQLGVDYAYWPVAAVLQRLLPPGAEVPSAFETVGHIAHLNLRDEHLPYKHVIGQVLLDKNPRIRTVVNKVASIQNEFRVFPMEVLAEAPPGPGGSGTETEVRQHGARFQLDFAQVYWNSRLEREHQRLVALFQPGQVVLDAMAGIGPFAVPAAQKGCLVYANDLNPASYRYLCTNIKINRLGGSGAGGAVVLPFCADGRAFMRQAAAGQLDVAAAAAVVPAPPPRKPKHQQQQQTKAAAAEGAAGAGGEEQAAVAVEAGQQPPSEQQQAAAPPPLSSGSRCFHHVVMNLPASAVEFLDALRGAFCPQLWRGQALPLVHVYTFATGEDEVAGLRQRVERHLGGALDEEPAVHLVRDVAPRKIMCCVTFRVPASIAFAAAAAAANGDDDGTAKRQKVT